MKRFAVASLKGGVGKTALTVLLARALSAQGRSVLAVDLDPNNNTTDYFLRGGDGIAIGRRNVLHALAGEADFAECVHEATCEPSRESGCGVSVLPCTPALGVTDIADEWLLRFVSGIKRLPFDVVLFDTPPSLSRPLELAVLASETVLTPVPYGRWMAQGLPMLGRSLVAIRRRSVPRLLAVPAIVTPVQEEKLRASGIGEFTKTAIHRSAAIHTACDQGKALSVKSKSYGEFLSLAEEVWSL
jgi:chromosome partitioning protein